MRASHLRASADPQAHCEEQELLARLLSHDPGAWREFHARYDRLIFRCIHLVLQPFTSQPGSDSSREVCAIFLLALQERNMHKLRAFDATRGPSFSYWIARLASNCATDFLRAQLRRQATIVEDERAEPRCGRPDPYREVLARRNLTIVRTAIARLTARDRQLFALSFEDGSTPDQIAERMRVSV